MADQHLLSKREETEARKIPNYFRNEKMHTLKKGQKATHPRGKEIRTTLKAMFFYGDFRTPEKRVVLIFLSL